MVDLDEDGDEFDIDALENEFFEQYMSPEDQQLSDPDADDDDSVPVTEHSTLDAVRTLFEDRLTEAQLEELAEDLDVTSTTWMNIDEYRAANSDIEIDDAFGDFDDGEDGDDD
jgi:response regulator of citrate/malate metabolism